MAVLDHHRVIEHGHVGHAAVAMAGVEIGAEHRILLRRRHQRAHLADDVLVALGNALHALGRSELVSDDSHRHAGAAGLAGRTVGDRLAAAEPAVGQQIVEAVRALADEMREHLPLFLARQIRTRRRSRQVELWRIARMLGHGFQVRFRPHPAHFSRNFRPKAGVRQTTRQSGGKSTEPRGSVQAPSASAPRSGRCVRRCSA